MKIVNNDDNHYININNTQDNYLITRMNDSEVKECRICLEEEDDESKLIIPCKCKGTNKYVHKYCLHKWRYTVDENIRNRQIIYDRQRRCGICKTRYREERLYPVETYYLSISSRNVLVLYVIITFLLSFFIGSQEYYSGFIIKSLTDDKNMISLYRNATLKNSDLFNTYVYSYTAQLINMLLFIIYIVIIIKNIHRYKLFLSMALPTLAYLFIIFIASHRGLFYLFSDISIYMYIFSVNFIYIVSPLNYYIIKRRHNRILDKMNDNYNPSTVLPYDPELSIIDDDNDDGYHGDNDQNENEEENNEEESGEEEESNEEEEESNEEEEEESNEEESGDRYMINIEEELLALGNISEEELFKLLEKEHQKEMENKKEKEMENKKMPPNNESKDLLNNVETISEDNKTKSKYVIHPYENMKCEENKKTKNDVNIELVNKKVNIIKTQIDDNLKKSSDNNTKTIDSVNKKIILDDVVLIDIEEGDVNDQEEYCKKVIQNSLDSTIDQIIQDVLNETYNENLK